jgi:transaldolase
VRIFVDTAFLAEIEEWAAHPWVSGFTTNATLVKQAGANVQALVDATSKEISVEHGTPVYGTNVRHKVTRWYGTEHISEMWNLTAVCSRQQVPISLPTDAIISVFAGRIMDTGRDPQPVIDAAKATGAQVLWASVREPYNILQAEQAGCDIVTVPPAILRKWLDWNGKPLEVVAEETIAQFDQDREGLW